MPAPWPGDPESQTLPGAATEPMDNPVKLSPGGPPGVLHTQTAEVPLVTLELPLLEAARKNARADKTPGPGVGQEQG